MTDWSGFYAATASRAARPLCTEVLALAGPGAGRAAVDLGCGSGTESAAMLAAGWNVTAVDSAVGTLDRVAGEAPGATVVEQALAHFELPPTELVFASYSLPFLRPAEFELAWSQIVACLRPGGWLALNLFGVSDTWARDAGMTFHTADQARALLVGLDVVAFRENEYDGAAVSGLKHWHVFDVIARG